MSEYDTPYITIRKIIDGRRMAGAICWILFHWDPRISLDITVADIRGRVEGYVTVTHTLAELFAALEKGDHKIIYITSNNSLDLETLARLIRSMQTYGHHHPYILDVRDDGVPHPRHQGANAIYQQNIQHEKRMVTLAMFL